MFTLSRLALALWPAILASSPLFAAEAAIPPLYLFINDKPSAEALSVAGQSESSDQAPSYRLTTHLAKGSYQIRIADKAQRCGSTLGPEQATPLPFAQAKPLGKCASAAYQLKVLLAGDYEFTLANANTEAPTLSVLRATRTASVKRALPQADCQQWQGGAVTASVGKAWPDGTWLRDAYSGQQAQVRAGKITLTPAPGSEGILLLEPVKADANEQAKPPFSWATVCTHFLI